MNKKLILTIGIGLVAIQASSGVQAAPVWGEGLNNGFFNNYENTYRKAEDCNQTECIMTGNPLYNAENTPSGWFLTNPTIGNNVKIGDVFAGVFTVQNISHADGTPDWLQSTTNQFTGYFAQQVSAIDLDGAAGTTLDKLTFSNPTADPFGILEAGEMFRFFTDTGGTATTIVTSGPGVTVNSAIGQATNGEFWGSFGLKGIDNDGVGANPDGYAYANVEIGGGISTFNQSDAGARLALDLIKEGDSYNLGVLSLINDLNENLVGGFASNPNTGLCNQNPAFPVPARHCNTFLATSELEVNPDALGEFGELNYENSPFAFLSNDPFLVYNTNVPEPTLVAMLGIGLFGFAGARLRQRG